MNERRQPPKVCDACSSPSIIYTTEADVKGTNKRKWPYIWYCRNCKASVGCHPNTNLPLGYMASPYISHLRATLHAIIDPLWQSKLGTRKEIYSWIAKELCLSDEFCHIAQLSLTQLKIAIEFSTKYAEANKDKVTVRYDRKERKKYKSERDRASKSAKLLPRKPLW
jgi:hypothetical protein